MSEIGLATGRYHTSARTRNWIAGASMVVAFFIYAAGILIVHGQQRNDFFPERSSIAAAVSNAIYRAPLGTVYSGVLGKFLETNVPLDKTLEEAARKEIPPGGLLGSTSDGNGIGYIVVASLSMHLYGPHTSSMVIGMLVLMGISALAFAFRFRGARVVVVVLYFTALTLMLFSPLVWNPTDAVDYPIGGARYWANYPANISIGGIRYFSLVAILPAFHLILECASWRGSRFRMTKRAFVPMALQIVILMLAVLVRNSAAPLIAAIATGCVLAMWSNRKDPAARARTLYKTGNMILVAVVFIGLLMLSASKTYLSQGRFTETLWHRIFVSYGISPEWPFGNLREIYDCTKYIPKGLIAGTEDQNGHCIFLDYAEKNKMPIDAIPTLTYSRQYDVALREAFFKIAWLYPAQTLKTFLYYKPLLISWSIEQSMKFKFSGVPLLLKGLLIAALGNCLVIALVSSRISRSSGYLQIAGATVLFAAFSTVPYIAVWAMPYTSADLFFYSLFGVGLAASAIVLMLRRRILPRRVFFHDGRTRSRGIGRDAGTS